MAFLYLRHLISLAAFILFQMLFNILESTLISLAKENFKKRGGGEKKIQTALLGMLQENARLYGFIVVCRKISIKTFLTENWFLDKTKLFTEHTCFPSNIQVLLENRIIESQKIRV